MKIEQKKITCDYSSTAQQEIIVFRFENLTQNKLSVEFFTNLWYNHVSSKQSLEESRINIELNAREIIEANCENKNEVFYIFSNFTINGYSEGYNKLTKFELKDLKINYEK